MNSSGDIPELEKIYVNNNTLIFDGEINENTVHKAIRLIKENEIKDIELSTFGGSLHHALQLIGIIKSSDHIIDIKIVGFAMSAGTIILASATGKKIMCKDSVLMYHAAAYLEFGIYRKREHYHNRLDEIEFNDLIFSRILNPENDENKAEFIKKSIYGTKELFLTAEEALDFGFIDEIA